MPHEKVEILNIPGTVATPATRGQHLTLDAVLRGSRVSIYLYGSFLSLPHTTKPEPQT